MILYIQSIYHIQEIHKGIVFGYYTNWFPYLTKISEER